MSKFKFVVAHPVGHGFRVLEPGTPAEQAEALRKARVALERARLDNVRRGRHHESTPDHDGDD